MRRPGRLPRVPFLSRSAREAQREARVSLVLGVAERFVHDLGLLMGGAVPRLDDYVAPASAARLREALRPTAAGAAPVRPCFGDYAQVRIEGDLLDTSVPVRATVEFDDHSGRMDDLDHSAWQPGRRVRLRLLLDPSVTTVLDHRVNVCDGSV